MANINILVVEDEVLIAEDIREILTNIDYEVGAVANDVNEAMEALRTKSFDIALLDLNLGTNTFDGLVIAEEINRNYFFPFIFLTSYSSKKVVDEVKQSKPMGYIVKPFNEAELFTTIEIALHNHAQKNKPTYFSREYLNKKARNKITEKEFEIIQDMYEGMGNKQLAEQHFLSVNTIKSHIKNIYNKLGCHSRVEMMNYIKQL